MCLAFSRTESYIVSRKRRRESENPRGTFHRSEDDLNGVHFRLRISFLRCFSLNAWRKKIRNKILDFLKKCVFVPAVIQVLV